MVHRDGSIRWFRARGSLIRDEQGTPVGLTGSDTDITERRRSEEALRQAEELNKRIVQSTGDCVKILALDGRITYINPEGLNLLEMTDARELLDRHIHEFFAGEVRQRAEEAVAAARSGGRGRFQAMLPAASGTPKVVGHRGDADHRRERGRRPVTGSLARCHRTATR